MIVSSDRAELLAASRRVRRSGERILLVWPLGVSRWACFVAGPDCPCLECFEVLNPKMFSNRGPSAGRLLPGFLRKWIAEFRGGRLPRGRVRFAGRGEAISVHRVRPSEKCPARLEIEGFRITP